MPGFELRPGRLRLGRAVELVVADLDVFQRQRRRILAVVALAALLEAFDLVAEIVEHQLPAAEAADRIADHFLQRFAVVLLFLHIDLGQGFESSGLRFGVGHHEFELAVLAHQLAVFQQLEADLDLGLVQVDQLFLDALGRDRAVFRQFAGGLVDRADLGGVRIVLDQEELLQALVVLQEEQRALASLPSRPARPDSW
jgi:hypothetical protein